MRTLKTMTQAETRALVRRALDLGSPQSFTVGEVRRAVALAAGCDVGRPSVEGALKEMVAAGQAMVELKTVIRNGFEVENARHFYAQRPKVDQGGCGTGAECDPFAGLTDDQRLVQESFREASDRIAGRTR